MDDSLKASDCDRVADLEGLVGAQVTCGDDFVSTAKLKAIDDAGHRRMIDSRDWASLRAEHAHRCDS